MKAQTAHIEPCSARQDMPTAVRVARNNRVSKSRENGSERLRSVER
jgi:hypothetical protein